MEELKLAIHIIVFILLLGYYTAFGIESYLDEANTKVEFWVILFPFGLWVLQAIYLYKKLK